MQKNFLRLCCWLGFGAAAMVTAQDPAGPALSPRAGDAALAVPATAPIEPPPLIPAPPLPPPGGSSANASPDLSQLDALFKTSPLAQVTADYRLHVEWRTLKNRTSSDAAVIAARESVMSASTDVIKRERFRVFYQTFYSRMRALASPEMRGYLDARQTEHAGLLAQPRVRPASPSFSSTLPANQRRLP